MAEMELQGAQEAVGDRRRGFAKTLCEDNDEQQLDVLARLGKWPILKVLILVLKCGGNV